MGAKTLKPKTKSKAKAKKRGKASRSDDRGVDAERLLSGLWPAERAILFKPERLKYVRKIVHSETCVFCDALHAGLSAESLVLATNDSAMLMMNKYPYNSGHLLVLPRRHVGDLLEFSDDEMRDVQGLLKKGIAALKQVYNPGGFNVGINLGSAAGAGIPDHVHWHVVPRWSGDVNFFPLIADTKVVIETLEQTYERLRPLL